MRNAQKNDSRARNRLRVIAVGVLLVVAFSLFAASGNESAYATLTSDAAGAAGSASAANATTIAGAVSSAGATASKTAKPTELIMHIGSPVALANGKLLPIDKDNPGLTPVIRETRTLVPLRVISEYFGAKVNYDAAKSEVSIDTGTNKAVFPVGVKYYFLNSERKTLDVSTTLIGGRAFVPLREICQETLGYTVDFKDNLIYIAPAAKFTDELIRDAKSKIGMYTRVTSLEALINFMGEANYYRGWGGIAVDMVERPMMAQDAMKKEMAAPSAAAPAPPSAAAPAPAPAAPAPESSASGALADGGFSTTNIQVEGVDEGDIIKTDGKYIYIISNNQLKIVNAASMTLAGEYFLGDNGNAQEMYIDKDRVTVIGSRYNFSGQYHWTNNAFTFVRTLDTSDLKDIKSFRYYEVEGDMTASRKKGDFVYLVSSFYNWYRGGEKPDPRPLIGEGGDTIPMPLDRIMIMPGGRGESFLTISAVNTRNADEKVASETIAGSGYVTYMSNDNLYVAIDDLRFSSRQTSNIARFSVDGARIGYAGSGGVSGGLNDQFSMDEHNGYLRVATSERWPRMLNHLYVIDKNMDIKGQVNGYAKDERIYSARFMGDRGYVVTFRETDPLFVFDLSDPAAPKITGELKVPGFSTYLHPVSPNVLLGVGRDVYDLYRTDSKGKQIVVGQRTGGVKISLFDVSDMGKPKEIDTLVLGDSGDTELLYNHKAAMFKNDDSLLGFCGGVSEDGINGKYYRGAFLISYAKNKLSEAGRIEYENPYADYSKGREIMYTPDRLAYIGNTLYYLQEGMLRSFDIRTLTPKAVLRLTVSAK